MMDNRIFRGNRKNQAGLGGDWFYRPSVSRAFYPDNNINIKNHHGITIGGRLLVDAIQPARLIAFLLLGFSLLPLPSHAQQLRNTPLANSTNKKIDEQPLSNYPSFIRGGVLQQGGYAIIQVPTYLAGPEQTGIKVVGVEYKNESIRLDEKRQSFIAFNKDDKPTQTITWLLANGARVDSLFYIKKSRYNIQSVHGIESKFVDPNPEQLERIKEENALVAKMRQESDPSNEAALRPFIWPAKGTISGIYGSQRILNGQPRNPHYGVDLAVPIGTPVMAPQAGRILLARDFFLSGKTLIIDHGMGVQSIFMHLDKFAIREGNKVKQGQVVAASGNSGRTTGPHLHWQVNWYDVKFNPQLLATNEFTQPRSRFTLSSVLR